MSEKNVFEYRGFVIREYKNFYTIDLSGMKFETLEEAEDYVDMYYYN